MTSFHRTNLAQLVLAVLFGAAGFYFDQPYASLIAAAWIGALTMMALTCDDSGKSKPTFEGGGFDPSIIIMPLAAALFGLFLASCVLTPIIIIFWAISAF
jgi:hypothetical protein